MYNIYIYIHIILPSWWSSQKIWCINHGYCAGHDQDGNLNNCLMVLVAFPRRDRSWAESHQELGFGGHHHIFCPNNLRKPTCAT